MGACLACFILFFSFQGTNSDSIPSKVPDVRRYIRSVEFHLDGSFAPNDVVIVKKPPFQILRESNHEFLAKVRLFFNKQSIQPFDMYHAVKVSYFKYSNQ